MSGNTPPVAPSDLSPSQTQEAASNGTDLDILVLEYLRAKGHTVASKALSDEINDSLSDSARPQTINSEELVKTLAVFSQSPSRPGENALKDSSAVLSELNAMGGSSALQTLISNISSVGAEEILTEDPSDKPEGFRELVAWVEGSLDMYRVCHLFTAKSCIRFIVLLAGVPTYSVSNILSFLSRSDPGGEKGSSPPVLRNICSSTRGCTLYDSSSSVYTSSACSRSK